MIIRFLGTSSGLPTRQRNVTAIAVAPEQGKRWYLVDCGEATQHRLLHVPLSLAHLQAILITHIHGDHCYGLPGLLATAATQGRTEPLHLVAPAAIEEYVAAVCAHTALHLPYPLLFHAVETLETLALPDFEVTRVPLSHRVPSYAYRFCESGRPLKLDARKLKDHDVPPGPAWGRLQHGESVWLEDGRLLPAEDYTQPMHNRRFIIGGDNDRPELLHQAARDIDLLVHEATYTAEVARAVEPGPQHSSAESVARFAEGVRLPNLILTHFSQRYHRPGGMNIEEIRDEARRHYSGNLYLANDMEAYRLDGEGVVHLCYASGGAHVETDVQR